MHCLICRKHAVKTAQIKDERDFIQTPSLRMKSDALIAQHSERHTPGIRQEMLQRMSNFHKDIVEQKEVSRDVLEKCFAIAYSLLKEHIENRKFLQLVKFAEEILESTDSSTSRTGLKIQ